MAKVLAVNVSENKGEIKHNVDKILCKIDHGIVGDAHAGNWHRQISLLGQESINKMIEMGAGGLCSGNFAENITTEGIKLFELPVGTKLKVGDEVILEVTQIGKKCHGSECQIFKQVGDCVMPREGIFTKVITEGWIKPEDEIIIDTCL